MGLPLVSVVIPGYRPDLMQEAIRSVEAQTYPNIEIVPVLKAAKPTDTHHVVADKVNEGVARARGAYLTILCDDDELAPEHTARCVEACEDSGADLAYTDVTAFGEKVSILSKGGLKLFLPDFDPEVLRFRTVMWMTHLCRRAAWDKCGGFDREQPYMDWAFGIEAWEQRLTVKHLKGEHLYRWRDHPQNGSRRMDGSHALRLLRDKYPVWKMPDSEETSTVIMAMQFADQPTRQRMMEAALAAKDAPARVPLCA